MSGLVLHCSDVQAPRPCAAKLLIKKLAHQTPPLRTSDRPPLPAARRGGTHGGHAVDGAGLCVNAGVLDRASLTIRPGAHRLS